MAHFDLEALPIVPLMCREKLCLEWKSTVSRRKSVRQDWGRSTEKGTLHTKEKQKDSRPERAFIVCQVKKKEKQMTPLSLGVGPRS